MCFRSGMGVFPKTEAKFLRSSKSKYVYKKKCPALIIKEILLIVTKYMSLNDVMLSEINQARKTKFAWFQLYADYTKKLKTIRETKNKVAVLKG